MRNAGWTRRDCRGSEVSGVNGRRVHRVLTGVNYPAHGHRGPDNHDGGDQCKCGPRRKSHWQILLGEPM